MRPKNDYVFSEYERSRFKIGIGIALFYLVFCVPLLMIYIEDYKSGPNYENLLPLFGILAGLMILAPLLIYSDHVIIRKAKYEITEDFVCIRFGRTTRCLRCSDSIHIALKTMTFGKKAEILKKKYYVLWKQGTVLPSEIGDPYRFLKARDVLLLPNCEEVRRMLCVFFGDESYLTQRLLREPGADLAATDDDTDFLYPDSDRGGYKGILGVLPFFSVAIPALLFLVFSKGRCNGAGFLTMGAIFLSFLCITVCVSKSKKFRFTRYRITENAVYMRLQNEERVICASKPFRIALRTVSFGRYNEESERQYIVLWHPGDPTPQDNAGLVAIMKQPGTVLLPNTYQVRSQLEQTLGVKSITQ